MCFLSLEIPRLITKHVTGLCPRSVPPVFLDYVLRKGFLRAPLHFHVLPTAESVPGVGGETAASGMEVRTRQGFATLGEVMPSGLGHFFYLVSERSSWLQVSVVWGVTSSHLLPPRLSEPW